jgi:hypothetical protein
MTTDQAVNRQADHENLIRELADALRVAYTHVTDSKDAAMIRAVLAKVQSCES